LFKTWSCTTIQFAENNIFIYLQIRTTKQTIFKNTVF